MNFFLATHFVLGTFFLKFAPMGMISAAREAGKLMEGRELVSTGMYLEKQAKLNMERCAEFMARMIQKYGTEILGELDAEKEQETVGGQS